MVPGEAKVVGMEFVNMVADESSGVLKVKESAVSKESK